MEDSNIFFSTNTYNYGGEYEGPTRNRFDESKGNVEFFRKVMDYDALVKLKNHPRMYGSMTSNYYVAHISQIHVLDPSFMSVMLAPRKADPEIEEENKRKDTEYGYPAKNNYYPLLEEIVIDDSEMSYADFEPIITVANDPKVIVVAKDDGKLEKVYTAEWEGDTFWINGNMQYSWSFYQEAGQSGYTCMDGYYHTASSAIGVVIIDPNTRYTCQDYLDLSNYCYRDPPLVYGPNEFINVLKNDPMHFNKHYTFALFNSDNLPQVIYRYYSAIEEY